MGLQDILGDEMLVLFALLAHFSCRSFPKVVEKPASSK